jgi:hypothetical protein
MWNDNVQILNRSSVIGHRSSVIGQNKQPAITHRRLLRILVKPKYVSPIREAGIE